MTAASTITVGNQIHGARVIHTFARGSQSQFRWNIVGDHLQPSQVERLRIRPE